MQINKTCEKYCSGRQHTVNSQSSTFDKNTGTYCNNHLLHNQPQHNYPHRDGWLLLVFGSHCSNKTGTLYNAFQPLFFTDYQARLLLTIVIYLWQRGVTHVSSQAAISYKSMKVTKNHSQIQPEQMTSSLLWPQGLQQTPWVYLCHADTNTCHVILLRVC